MSDKKLAFFRIVFVMAALWNLAGGIPGYFDSANMFHRLFDKELTDPLMTAIYKGSWGTTFLYFFGYLLVAYNPVRHTGVVILGTIGKVFFRCGFIEGLPIWYDNFFCPRGARRRLYLHRTVHLLSH